MFVDNINVFSNLPQTTINKAVNDLRKRLNARVSADVNILCILCELGSRTLKLEIIESKFVI